MVQARIVCGCRRLSSEFFPWGNVHYKLCDLPDYQAIKEALAEAGEYARAHNHRLTTHPCEFVKLAGVQPFIPCIFQLLDFAMSISFSSWMGSPAA